MCEPNKALFVLYAIEFPLTEDNLDALPATFLETEASPNIILVQCPPAFVMGGKNIF